MYYLGEIDSEGIMSRLARSLKISRQHEERVRQAVIRNGFASQQDLADVIGLCLSTVNRFLNRKAVNIHNFQELSYALGLNWKEIADFEKTESYTTPTNPPPQLIQTFEHYIERYPIESLCYETISKPGSLLRIKSPKSMGKSLLVDRILVEAIKKNYQIVFLDLKDASEIMSSSLNDFLRWFCTVISQQLELSEALSNYWMDNSSSVSNCNIYFKEHLLPKINSPLVLALDEVDRIFDASFADNFLGMLRGWHEKAKSRPLWQKLRLVLAHATDIYIPLDKNHSPFNIGVPIELPEFTSEQIQALASQQGVIWDDSQVQQIICLLGGHPCLVQKAIGYLKMRQNFFEEMLQKADTEEGIYNHHLRVHWLNLQQYPELLEAMKQVVQAHEPVRLETTLAFKLQSLGLTVFEGNNVKPRCNLYAKYFKERLSY